MIAYDEEQATAEPLKVEFRNGRWIMPSHDDYPAEAGDRLAKTAGALLGLKKDRFVSDRVEDHAQYGVIDPLETEVASLAGRGKRVTLRNESGDVLADLIIGKSDADHEGYRYVRPPGREARLFGQDRRRSVGAIRGLGRGQPAAPLPGPGSQGHAEQLLDR